MPKRIEQVQWTIQPLLRFEQPCSEWHRALCPSGAVFDVRGLGNSAPTPPNRFFESQWGSSTTAPGRA